MEAMAEVSKEGRSVVIFYALLCWMTIAKACCAMWIGETVKSASVLDGSPVKGFAETVGVFVLGLALAQGLVVGKAL